MAETNTGARPTEYMGSLIAAFHRRRCSSGSRGACLTTVPSGSMIPSGVKAWRGGGTSPGWPGKEEDAAAHRNISLVSNVLEGTVLLVRKAWAVILNAAGDGHGRACDDEQDCSHRAALARRIATIIIND